MNIQNLDYFRKLLPLWLWPITLAASDEKAPCGILSQQRLICKLEGLINLMSL